MKSRKPSLRSVSQPNVWLLMIITDRGQYQLFDGINNTYQVVSTEESYQMNIVRKSMYFRFRTGAGRFTYWDRPEISPATARWVSHAMSFVMNTCPLETIAWRVTEPNLASHKGQFFRLRISREPGPGHVRHASRRPATCGRAGATWSDLGRV
ncbi:hypothetical protein J6590_019096 [Homalodisca vitripennis]|nr:hypothetical protein J6590_019096 [Homalodisca vitripennis]